ncbi:Metalloproteases (zincins), catalytic [Glarea lozoyensis ATCC 20868]|uniref:Metalloproteases (Zincins), catalytic n=1 Tax=Glarea lozoyensis (strain ATCC 20868 / MF5171) TaxID=1116229 RepID=S3DBD6_GLAL2|nr:Metalloproteases (zincins), catalytic [Glarea lozoyensis ATCC 20868]EPE35762.1 Metalloproteases (zincins), catalytic [Glarea lozoyensis ATCC 20868]
MQVPALLLVSTWFSFTFVFSAFSFLHLRSLLPNYKRAEHIDFFPFPANKSSLSGKFTQVSQRSNPRSDDEAKLLANAQTNLIDGYEYNIAHTQWLGKDWNTAGSEDPYFYDYRGFISDNFARLDRLIHGISEAKESIYWYCNDVGHQCTDTTYAYSWDGPENRHHTVFCPAFHKRPTLADQITKHANDVDEQKVIENFQLSRGQIMFHEIWHYGFVSYPRAGDYAYLAEEVWALSHVDKGTLWAYINADSYALDAVAIYVHQHYNSSMPPVPFDVLRGIDSAATAGMTPPQKENAEAKTLADKSPPGWVTPNPSIWLELDSENPAAPPKLDRNVCHGISGEYWAKDRDVVIQNSREFCKQTESTKEYNNNTVDYLELTAKKLGDPSKTPKDDPGCAARFQLTVIDGCDGGDVVNNPQNHKYGGTFTAGDKWEYSMTPKVRQLTAVDCTIHFDGKGDRFEIRGRNFPSGKLGLNGEGLRKQMGSCKGLFGWKFDWTPDDCCWEWYARGWMIVQVKQCPSHAVRTAGAPSDANCRRYGIGGKAKLIKGNDSASVDDVA